MELTKKLLKKGKKEIEFAARRKKKLAGKVAIGLLNFSAVASTCTIPQGERRAVQRGPEVLNYGFHKLAKRRTGGKWLSCTWGSLRMCKKAYYYVLIGGILSGVKSENLPTSLY